MTMVFSGRRGSPWERPVSSMGKVDGIVVRHQVNDLVVYGSNGVFRIDGVCKKKIDGRETEYYVLKPVYEHGVSTAYVPVENEQLTAKLRPLLSRQEVVELIDSLPHMQTPWIESQDVRREKYREILHKGDRIAMIRAIRALHLHRREQEARGKRLYLVDEHFLKEAERLLYDEFAVALQMEPKQVLPYILQHLQVG